MFASLRAVTGRLQGGDRRAAAVTRGLRRLDLRQTVLERAARVHRLGANDGRTAGLRRAAAAGDRHDPRGDATVAEDWARQAVAHAVDGKAYAPDEHTECLLVLARALQAAGKDADARDAAAEALRITEAQEFLVMAQQARELLGTAQPVAVG